MVEEGEISSTSEKQARWGYESHFREYLLLIGNKGKDALESIDNFPSQIELVSAWHNTHLKMRDGTKKDGKERLSVVGFRTDRQLVLPIIPASGTDRMIPSELFYEELHRARTKGKIQKLIGGIHSHPSDSPFSAGDLFSLLVKTFTLDDEIDPQEKLPPSIKAFSGVVTPNQVIYAFITRESFAIDPFKMWPNHLQIFQNYWYEKSGFKYNGEEKLEKTRPDANLWDVSFGIAEAHNLALYKGKFNEDLTRIFPRQE